VNFSSHGLRLVSGEQLKEAQLPRMLERCVLKVSTPSRSCNKLTALSE
jgi:hypothetical protein